jgi:hypothetical protein
VGKWGTGLIWLCTGGLLVVGVVVDFIMILLAMYKDKEGRPLVEWL